MSFLVNFETTFWLGIMLAACLITGCSPTFRAPTGLETSSPIIAENTFTTFDDTVLPFRSWLPTRVPDGVIVAVHGFNDYSNFMKDTALFFNERNFAVYSYDQRGFGETETRGYWGGWQAMADDLVTLISLIRGKYSDLPLYILGDSMGGAVTIVTLTERDPPPVDGVILVAPAVWARSQMPFYQRFALWLGAHTIPWKKVTGESLEITPSDNIEMLRELGKDPLVIKGTRIGVLYGLSNLMDQAYQNAEKFNDRALIVYGEKDEIIPRTPVVAFFERLPEREHGHQQMILYKNGYHMLLRDLEAEKVLIDIFSWITTTTKPHGVR